MAAPIDASGLIPPNVASQVLTEAYQASAALQLGRRVPLPAGVTTMPVPASFPSAAWTSVGSRKAVTDFSFDEETITAEELAAVITIPDTYLEDSSINLWNYARPLLSEAIAVALDQAVLWGLNAPATFPTGGVAAAAQTAAAGADVVDTVNKAMSLVEAEGLRVTGHAADLKVQGAFRGVRDATGALLLGPGQTGNVGIQSLYGVPVAFSAFDAAATTVDFLTGDWTKLIIGVRQDIRFEMSTDFVIADPAGVVLVSGFQDNQTAMKVWARYGAAILKPVTRRAPTGAKPFSKADLAA